MRTLARSSVPTPAVTMPRIPGRRLIRAELLKLTRQRGLMIAAAIMTVGAIIIYFTVAVSLHAANPRHAPAGGIRNLGPTTYLLQELGSTVAILLGAFIGTTDVSAGLFRSLVTTGRSRITLYLARVPAGLAVLLAFISAAFALTAFATIVFAGDLASPTPVLLAQTLVWLVLETSAVFVLALGASSLWNSQSATIAVLFVLILIITPLAAQSSITPDVRQLFLGVALGQLAPQGLGAISKTDLNLSNVSVAVVALAWTAIPLLAGAWRTATRDA